jgi:hypothetical protein
MLVVYMSGGVRLFTYRINVCACTFVGRFEKTINPHLPIDNSLKIRIVIAINLLLRV